MQAFNIKQFQKTDMLKLENRSYVDNADLTLHVRNACYLYKTS